MNQRISHSNTPKFTGSKSQTSAILYQEPTLKETNPKPKPVVEFLKNFAAGALLVIVFFALVVVILKGCADGTEHRHAMAVKHQMQFSENK